MKKISQTTIAIADRQPIMRKGVIHLLNETDCNEIIEASSGTELIKKIAASESLPDICLIDIYQPEMGGFKTIDIIKENWPTIKILVFTMLFNSGTNIDLPINAVNGIVAKNASTTEIRAAIFEIVNDGSYYSNKTTKNALVDFNKVYENSEQLLTEKELEFIKYCCTELTYKEIAHKMNVKIRAVDNYREKVFLQLQLKCRTGIVMFAIKSGIVML